MFDIKITSYENFRPIILGSNNLHILQGQFNQRHITLKDLNTYLKDDPLDSNKITRYETRDISFFVSKGVIYYKDYNLYSFDTTHKLLLIICFDTNTNKYSVLVNKGYITAHPNHKTFINSFIKRYGFNPRKDVEYVFHDFLKNFKFKVSQLALQKLTNPNNQKQFLQDFKKEELWKIPV